MIPLNVVIGSSLTIATPLPQALAMDLWHIQALSSATASPSAESDRSEALRDLAAKLDRLSRPPRGSPRPSTQLLQRARDFLTSALIASLELRRHWPRPFLAFGDDLVAEWSGDGWSLTLFFDEDDEGVFWVRSPGGDPDGSEEGVLRRPDDFVQLLDWMAVHRAQR